jgi:tight adherence protein C
MNLMLVLLAGILVSAGLSCFVLAAVPTTPRLSEALARIAIDPQAADRPIDLGPLESTSDRLGAWLYRITPIPLTVGQRKALRLRGKSIAEFYADKAVMALVGAVLPSVLAVALWMTGTRPGLLPALLCLIGAAGGFFLPDLLLLRSTTAARSDAVESLLVLIDLVTLERLANASSSQALEHASSLSDVTLFRQIRLALERAQLEQQSPYAQLRRLADQLDLPELRDLADIMQLDESGAALSGALRARLQELRDAHLTREQMAASAAAEGMTIYMTVPALIFGLIFLGAALLRILEG